MLKSLMALFSIIAICGCKKSKVLGKCTGSVQVFATTEAYTWSGNSSTDTMGVGDIFVVVDSVYGKDYLLFEIEYDGGRGFVAYGDSFDVNR